MLVSAQNYQEVVYLKNGSIIRGMIIEQIPNESLKIKTADGNVFVFKMDEIEKMTKEAPIQTQNQSQAYGYATDYRTDAKSAKFRKRGYRAFVETGGAVGIGEYGDGVFSVSTSHGFQFNPYFYVGGGLALEYHGMWEEVFVPVFANARVNFLKTRVTPFFDMKMGVSLSSSPGFYMCPSVGVGISFTPRLALNIGMGFNLQMAEFYEYSYYSYDTETEAIGGIIFKVGLSF